MKHDFGSVKSHAVMQTDIVVENPVQHLAILERTKRGSCE